MPRVVSAIAANPEVSQSTPFRSHGTFQITSRILYDVNGVEEAQERIKVVRRRYKEFVLLQECLRANNPGCILPPLPPPTLHCTAPSHLTGVVKPSRELLQTRLVLLQRYLDNILAIRSLHTDPSFWLFVESERFPEMVSEFRLLERGPEGAPRTRVLRDSPRYPDAVPNLEDRLDYLLKITNRLEILKGALSEFFASQTNLADRMTDMGKALTGYLDSTTDGGKHGKLIQLIDSIDSISELLAVGTGQLEDARSFIVIVDDYIRMMQEVEQAFALKRVWRSAVYTLEVQIIDTQAALIKSQGDKNRSFDRNFTLSESFLKMREELREASTTYDTLCQKLNGELDRIDSQRMLEVEQCINRLLRNLLNAQTEIVAIWEGYLAMNESVISLAADSDTALFSPL